MNFKKLLATVLIALFCTSAAAVPVLCDASIENNVSSSSGCQLGSTNNDFLNPLQVNVDEMFGYNDWLFGEKAFENDQAMDLGLSLLGDTLSGTWSIDDLWATYSDVMLVIKGGANNNTVTTYVGYLLTPGSTAGSYFTPFNNLNNNNPKDISHMSIYVRGPSITVPEASILSLLLIGGGLMAVSRRRRRD